MHTNYFVIHHHCHGAMSQDKCRPGTHHQSVNHHHRDLAGVKAVNLLDISKQNTNRNGWCEKYLDICQPLILWLFGIGYIEYYIILYIYTWIWIYIYIYIWIYNKYYEQRSNNLIYLPSFWQFGNLAMFAGWSSIHQSGWWLLWMTKKHKKTMLWPWHLWLWLKIGYATTMAILIGKMDENGRERWLVNGFRVLGHEWCPIFREIPKS